MDTAIGTFQAAITPKHGKIRPVDIFWLARIIHERLEGCGFGTPVTVAPAARVVGA